MALTIKINIDVPGFFSGGGSNCTPQNVEIFFQGHSAQFDPICFNKCEILSNCSENQRLIQTKIQGLRDLLEAQNVKNRHLWVLISLEFLLLWHFRKVFYGKIYLTALRVKMPTSRKPIVSYRPYSGDLLILMPRIRILHFPGPELAGLSKKSKRKFNF